MGDGSGFRRVLAAGGVLVVGVLVGDTLNILGTGPVEGTLRAIQGTPSEAGPGVRAAAAEVRVVNETGRPLMVSHAAGMPSSVEGTQDDPLASLGARGATFFELAPSEGATSSLKNELHPADRAYETSVLVLGGATPLEGDAVVRTIMHPVTLGEGAWEVRLFEQDGRLMVSAAGAVEGPAGDTHTEVAAP